MSLMRKCPVDWRMGKSRRRRFSENRKGSPSGCRMTAGCVCSWLRFAERNRDMVKIGVLGAGTWGMALARMLSNMGYDVMVWSALPKEVEEYSRTRRHPNLPGMIIPDSIRISSPASSS